MDANLNSRVFTAALAVPLLVLLVGWSPSWLFAAVFFAVTVGALHEYFTMAFPNRSRDRGMGIAFGICLSAAIFLDDYVRSLVWLDMVVLVAFCVYLSSGGELADRLNRLSISMLGAIYAGYFLSHWVLLFRSSEGRAWVFWVLAVVMSGDTMAYFIGRRFGVRKLAPEISPGKTLAGIWGYVIGAVIAGWLAALALFKSTDWMEISLLSVALSILGQMGDLFESWIKRVFGVKDSGNLLPGHGGLLDRLDSLIFPAVFTTAYLQAFHR